jgi:short-subunit dehydrogenase
MTKKAIIIGSSSGIGRELAMLLAADGYILGLVARREYLLQKLAHELPNSTIVKVLDVSLIDEAKNVVQDMITEMGGVDLFIISAGIGFLNPDLCWEKEYETINVNVSGFAAMVNVAMNHFIKNGSGHLVGISSIAALRGDRHAPAYNASKAFESNYLEGIRHKMAKSKLPIAVTDIQAGFVDTAMAKGENLFWVASPQEAARQIVSTIRKRKKHAYVTRRWIWVAWLLKLMPDWIYHRL